MCPFREKNPPHPDLENNAAHSGGRPGLFSMQAPTGCLQKEKSSSNPHNRQAMMFICNHEVVYCMFGLYISACFEVLNCVMLSFTEQLCNLTCSIYPHQLRLHFEIN